jgi:hypothetical protein
MAATNPAVAQNTSGSVSVPNVTRALSDCHRVSSELGKLPNPWRLLYDRLRVMCLSMVIASRTATSPSRSLSGFLEPIWIWKSRLRSSTSFASPCVAFQLIPQGFLAGGRAARTLRPAQFRGTHQWRLRPGRLDADPLHQPRLRALDARRALYGLVTPLRDGMNLVAKEYVASQNPHDPGVLILSRFAGAAHECKAALLVNPYDPDSVAVAIGQALSMPLAERRERHDSLFRVLSQNDIQHWADRFLSTLEREPSVLNRLEQMPSAEMQ